MYKLQIYFVLINRIIHNNILYYKLFIHLYEYIYILKMCVNYSIDYFIYDDAFIIISTLIALWFYYAIPVW